jgi:biopolymer transport protein ExbD
LLIFFIVTLQIPPDEGSLQAAVPKAKGVGTKIAPEEDERTEFNDINIVLAFHPQREQVMILCDNQALYTFDQLFARLRARHQYNPEARVVIDCKDNVPYHALVSAVNSAQGAGYRAISFANIR